MEKTTSKDISTFILGFLLLCILPSCSSILGSSEKESNILSDSDLARERGRWQEGNIPLADGQGPLADVLFDFDSYTVNDAYKERLVEDAQLLNTEPNILIEIEGHCDTRGTNEYNLVLGQKRATAVADLLTSSGVDKKRVSTISYGKSLPLEQGESEEAHSRNRRSHFVLSKKE